MNRQEAHGDAIRRCNFLVAPHDPSLNAKQKKSAVAGFADCNSLVWLAIVFKTTIPFVPKCYGYSPSFKGRAVNSSTRPSVSVIFFIATEMLLLSQNVIAAEWLISPSLNIGMTQSDNIRLAPRGSESADQVTQIDPGISMTGKGSALKFNANYQMQNIFYRKDSEAISRNHSFNTNANAELIDEVVFLDARAAISQSNISINGPLAASYANVTSNRAHIGSFSLTPYLRHNFNNIATSEIRYIRDAVYSRSAGFANRQADTVQVNLKNSPAHKTLGWGIDYQKQRINYSATIQTVGVAGSESYSVNLGYAITPQFTLKATSGHEKFDYLSTGKNPEGTTQTAGFSWIPTERTNIEAMLGHRFYGDTYMLNVGHRTRKTVWNLGYNEDITTTQAQFLLPATINTASFLNNLWSASIPDDAARQQYVDDFIQERGLPNSLADPINFSSNRVFLQKRLQASVAVTGKRNTILLSIFAMSRETQTSATMDSALLGTNNFATTDKAKQVGGNALWRLRISARTNGSISADALATGRKNYTRSLKLGISRQLQPKLTGSVELRQAQQHSDKIGGGYQENAVSASLLMKF
ncbi:MAG: TIGR03016 family PEP-CTERM system-associated outer membrane protein [Nitrosomonadales bacterium]|nr:TIGR03016 family PEP-CTERM system-associated outer membrane protein [Nitrosomonadales bacterium]